MASSPTFRQQVLVLYLQTSVLDIKVIGWSQYDGTAAKNHKAGDEQTPPTLAAWRRCKTGGDCFKPAPSIHTLRATSFGQLS